MFDKHHQLGSGLIVAGAILLHVSLASGNESRPIDRMVRGKDSADRSYNRSDPGILS
jgi:hypothetical protein